jgi:hypothetical protein
LSEEDRFDVDVDEPRPKDVNTPEEYERLTRDLETGDASGLLSD